MSTVDSDEAIRLQLDRISSSATFQQVDRLKRFLEFVVLETVAGRGNQMKEYVLGIQVFDKDNSFDPRTDPVVRVQARRLRARLARYYEEEGSRDGVVIEMPKGGYAPVFKKPEALAPSQSVTRALASRNTITVAPFSDQSSEGDLDYFCRGLCQEIVHTLTSCESVRVLWYGTPSPGTAAAPRTCAKLRTGSMPRWWSPGAFGGLALSCGSLLRLSMGRVGPMSGPIRQMAIRRTCSVCRRRRRLPFSGGSMQRSVMDQRSGVAFPGLSKTSRLETCICRAAII